MAEKEENTKCRFFELNGPTYHYDHPLTIGEVQLAAKTIRALITEDPWRNNTHLICCPMPKEAKDDWKNIETQEGLQYKYCYFYIETPNFSRLQYQLANNRQISSIEANVYLQIAQNSLQKIKDNTFMPTLQDADDLEHAFIFINNAISNYFFWQAEDEDRFDWKKKYSPCFFDRQRFLQFRGELMPELFLKVDGEKIALCKRYMVREFAMLVKYLTFWVSLLDVATFPGLPPKYKKVYDNLMKYLMDHYANIFVYDVVVETSPVWQANNTADRGSESNTTRVKMFFTLDNDDSPRLLRLDLPHVDYPYVHLNIECKARGENVHVRLSEDEEQAGEYDSVFDALVETLRLYNFFSITNRHTPVSDDRIVLKEMPYWTAMYFYAIAAEAYLYLGEECSIIRHPIMKYYRVDLIQLLAEDGITIDETLKLNPYDLFDLADGVIRKNNIIP